MLRGKVKHYHPDIVEFTHDIESRSLGNVKDDKCERTTVWLYFIFSLAEQFENTPVVPASISVSLLLSTKILLLLCDTQ